MPSTEPPSSVSDPACDGPAPDRKKPERAALRKRIDDLPRDEDLNAFLLDCFPEVHRELAVGMTRTQRVNILLEKIDDLADLDAKLSEWLNGRNAGRGFTDGPPTWLQNFLDEHLGTPERPVVFAGRNAEIQSLFSWLAEQGPSFGLITGPLGMGKSALMARLYKRIQETRNGWHVILVPLGPQSGIERKDEILHSLGRELARFRVCDFPTTQSLLMQRDFVAKLLEQPVPSGNLLVILDGIDEVADELRAAIRFPSKLPPNVRMIISAREGRAELSPDALIGQLGLGDGRNVQRISLGKLSLDEIRESVMTLPTLPIAPSAAERSELSTQLTRLTDGDPLLLRLYLCELENPESGVTASSLRSVPPGLSAYFERIWNAQRHQWRERAQPLSRLAEEVLALLATALGPMTLTDVSQILPEELNARGFSLDEALRPLGRWMRGQGSSDELSLAHPRLAEFFRTRFVLPVEAQRWEARVLAYGERSLAMLSKQSSCDSQFSAYLVRHLSTHMERAAVPIERMLAFLEGGWQRVSFSRTGSNASFLADVTRVGLMAKAADDQELAAGRTPRWLGVRVRSMLFAASVASRASQVPESLLVALVERGGWSVQRAATEARLMADPAERALTLDQLARRAPEAQAIELWHEALSAGASVEDGPSRSNVLATLFGHLPAELVPIRDRLLARELAKPLHAEKGASAMLGDYLPFLPESVRERVAIDALGASDALLPPAGRAHFLAKLAAASPMTAREQILRALDQLTARLVPYVSIQVLSELPDRQTPRHYLWAKTEAYRMAVPLWRAIALGSLATTEWVPAGDREALARDSLAALTEHKRNPAAALKHPPKPHEGLHLPAHFREMFDAFGSSFQSAMVEAEEERLILGLASCLSTEDLPGLECLSKEYPLFRKWVPQRMRAIIATRRQDSEVSALVSELRKATPEVRYACLLPLTPVLSNEQLTEALGLCQEIGDLDACIHFLTERLGSSQSIDAPDRVLAMIQKIPEANRLIFWRQMLPKVSPNVRPAIEQMVYQAAGSFSSQNGRLGALLDLLQSEDQRKEVYLRDYLELMRSLPFETPSERIDAIVDILPFVNPDQVSALLDQILDAVRQLPEKWTYQAHLGKWLGNASVNQRAELLQIARNRLPPECLVQVQISLIAHSSEGERALLVEQVLYCCERISIQDVPTELRHVLALIPERHWPRVRKLALRLCRGDRTSMLCGQHLLLALLKCQHPSARVGLLHDLLRVDSLRSGDESDVLVELVPFLSDRPNEQKALIARILKALQEPRSHLEGLRFLGMKALVPHLSEEQIRSAWARCGQMKEQDLNWGGYLLGLLPCLPKDLLPSAAKMAVQRVGMDVLHREELLSTLAQRLGELTLQERASLVEQILVDLAADDRQKLLRELDGAWPILTASATPDFVDQVINAVADVQAAFP